MKNIISLIIIILVVSVNYGQCPAVNAPYGESFSSGVLPNCWSQSVITGDGWQFTGTPGYDAANNGRVAGTYAWIDFSSDDQGVIMELIDVDVSSITAPQIEFDYFCYNTTNPTPANILNVEAFDGTNWVLISSIQINTLQGWNPYYFSLVGYDVSGIVTLRLRAESGGATNDFYNDILVDNLFIRQAPTCPSPLSSSFGVANLTADSAEISWLQGGSELFWGVEWGVSGFSLGSGSYDTTSNFFAYPVTGLSPITSYDFYVKAICGAGDSSYWAGPFTFVTPCATLVPPQLEDFTNVFPPNTCWDQAGDGDQFSGPTNIGTSSWFTDGFANVGTTGAVRCYLANTLNKEWVLSPQYDFSNGGPFQIEFDFGIFTASSSNPGTLGSDDYVSVLVSDDGGTSWEQIVKYDNNYVTNTNGNYEIVALTNSFLSTLNIDTNNFNINGTIQFAFWATDGRTNDLQSNDVMFDNFRVLPVPSCPQPQAISSFGITSDSASLTWASFASDSIWMVYLTPAGITPDSSHLTIVNNDTVTFSGLNSNTYYNFYVKGVCNIGDTSFLSGPFSVLTNCLPISSPYYQSFDNTIAPSIDQCWSVLSTGAGTIQTDNSAFNPQRSDPNSISMYNSSGGDLYFISPFISDLDSTKRIRFYLQNNGNAGYLSDLIIGTISDPNDATTFSPYDTILNSEFNSANWNRLMVNFNNYSGNDNHIAFKHGQNFTFDYIWLDDFYYEDIPSCLSPLPTTISLNSVSTDSANISWTSIPTHTSWLGYLVADSNTLAATNPIVLNSDSVNISVNHSTIYNFYVQSICGAGDTSIISGPITFTTPCLSTTAPYFNNFDSVFPICWRQEASTDIFDWSLNSGSTSSTLTGPSDDLTGGGNYIFIETSSPRVAGDQAVMYSENIDINTILAPELRFFSHMFGATIADLTIEISDNGGLSYNNIFTKSGDQGDVWVEEIVPIAGYSGTVFFKITGSVGSSFTGDIAIDNFEVREGPQNDLGVVLADLPSASTGCEGDSSYVTVTIVNFGYQPQSGFTIQYTLNGIPVIETISNTLQPGDSLIHIFSVPVDLTQDGSYSFDFTTNLPNDDNTTNDAFGSTLTFENYFTPAPPNVINDTVCVNSLTPKGTSAKLIASGNSTANFEWFDSAGNYLASGDTLFTDTINTITSYFVSSKELAPGNIGAPTNNFGAGSGGFDNLFPNGLVFNVYSDLTIDSVTIYPDGPGTIQIKIVNIIGATIYSNFYTIGQNINPGSKLKVPIGQNITAGNGYIIEVSFVNSGNLSLYRNTINASYPYNYSNIASIISSTNGSTDSYFYFYNWDISTISCSSEKSEAVVYIDQCVGIEKINYSSFNIYPNPNNGCFEINFINPSLNTKIEIFDLAGKIIHKKMIINEVNYINLNKFSSGFYLVNAIQNGKISTKKLQILK
jgi:hypothetical protein